MKNSHSFGKDILHILMKYQLCSFLHELVYPTDPSPSALTCIGMCKPPARVETSASIGGDRGNAEGLVL